MTGAHAERFPVGVPTHLRPIRPLGRGSSATVWEVRDAGTGRAAALKVLDVPISGVVLRDRIVPARLEGEVRSLARLRDVAGVVRLRSAGVTPGGLAWLLTDLAVGGSLTRRLEGGALDPTVVAEHGRVLAGALAAAHTRDVLHGDITPGNILFDADGAPLLADFGVAELIGGAVGPAGGAPVPGGLTPAFSAPERLRGAAPTAAADVWSLATCLLSAVGPAPCALVEVLRRGRAHEPARRPSAATLCTELTGLGRR